MKELTGCISKSTRKIEVVDKLANGSVEVSGFRLNLV